jgi:alanyl-tRNA synthetase
MTAQELREKYLSFFESKMHKRISSSSLIPENDPTVLFTTAGMHPLVPYLMGEIHPNGRRLTSVQKCVRTGDIDEVGDGTHLTFFEMLGNWSLQDYFKKEAIEWSFEFLTDKKHGLGLSIEKLAVSVFAGDENSAFDEEAFVLWCEQGISEARIARLGKKDNWWGPAGQTGPCGPDTEIFYWVGDEDAPANFQDTHDDKRWVEIWNNVFMQYNKTVEGKYEKLDKPSVDTGMGLERTLAVLSGVSNVYETELFQPIIEVIEKMSGKQFGESKEVTRLMRIIADHLRAIVMIIADGVRPSKNDRGYVLRKLIRKIVIQIKQLGCIEQVGTITEVVIDSLKDEYQYLPEKRTEIQEIISLEMLTYNKILQNTEPKIKKVFDKFLYEHGKSPIIADNNPPEAFPFIEDELAFELGKIAHDKVSATEGIPVEFFVAYLGNSGYILMPKDIEKFKEGFSQAKQYHQDISRTGAEQKFAGGLADHSEETKKLHTATHLLLQALRQVLGDHVEQRGSNITADRLRFDFSHDKKMTDEEKTEVERIVNDAIEQDFPIRYETLSFEEAKTRGAIGIFEDKYASLGGKVKVYFIGDDENGYFSKEVCGGPHVENTGVLGKFVIKKEEASSAGVRRIKAILC